MKSENKKLVFELFEQAIYQFFFYFRLYTPFHETSPSFGDRFFDAVRNSLILLGVVVVLTVLLIILYKKRCYKVRLLV